MISPFKRGERLRNLTLISVLPAVLILVLLGTARLSGSREDGMEAGMASDALGQANARTVTAFALYEIAQRNDPSGSRALLLAREAVLYYLDNDLPLHPEADSALRQAVDTAPPWRLTLPRHRHDDSDTVTLAADSPDTPDTPEGTRVTPGQATQPWRVTAVLRLL